jgi:DNA mismatch repair protein MutS2
MVVRKSTLRRRAEHGPGSVVEEEKPRRRDRTPFGQLVHFLGFGRSRAPAGTTSEIPMADLLSPRARAGPDPGRLLGLLDLAFLGRASAGEIDRELDAQPCGDSDWIPAHFTTDLYLSELVAGCMAVQTGDSRSPAHSHFVERVLTMIPADLETVRYRQAILREMEDSEAFAEAVGDLLSRIRHLLTLLRASRDDARLEPLRFRFDVLRAFRDVVVQMADAFEDSGSGLQRLHSVGRQIRTTPAFTRLEDLLDHHESMATLQLEAVVGADGRLRHLEIRELRERRKNPFFRRPVRRWLDRLRIVYHRYNLSGNELSERMVMGVYHEIAPALARVVQLVCHLEVYAANRSFAELSRSQGLDVCLPELVPGVRYEAEALFNPLLMNTVEELVPTDLTMDCTSPINLVTGPNSGGKTRLLQAVGIAQVLAQSGLYTPCRKARLPFAASLFASIVEVDRADQKEGRLGTELVRLRTLFERVPPGSLVLLDELCSGTNPSEAIEIVEMVLRLLRQLRPVAFVTTHYLDFARDLSDSPTDGLRFLHAEVGLDGSATFRFKPGVAATSLAAGTALRLGVTFEELEKTLEKRVSTTRRSPSEQVDQLPRRNSDEEG